MRAARAHAEQHIAGGNSGQRQQVLALDDANKCAGDVEGAGHVHARHLGGLAAEQHAARRSAGDRHTVDHGRHLLGADDRRRKVVEKEQRTGALYEHVVDAVVHDVLAGHVVAASACGEFDLGADTIGGCHQNRMFHAHDLAEIEGAAEGSDATEHRAGVCLFDTVLELIDGAGAFVDVDACSGIRRQRCAVRTPADVSAVSTAGGRHGVGEVVGGGAGVGECFGNAHGGVFAAASVSAKEQLVIGVGNLGAQRAQRWAGCWVAGGGDDNAERRCIANFDRRVCELTVAAGEHDLDNVGLNEWDEHLSLGVAESTVELEQLWAIGSKHQAGVEHADKRSAVGAHVVDDGLDELRCECVEVVWHRGRGERTHAAGVGAGVAFAETLVVLGEGQWTSGIAIAEGQQRAFGAA